MKRNIRKAALTKKLSKNKIDNLETATRKLIREANSRLDALQRHHKAGTWASKKLINRLSNNKVNLIRGGKIKLPKSPTRTQLIAVNKAASQFLSSKTSTHKGISSVRRQTIETLQGTLSTEEKQLTYAEAEELYQMFGEDNFSTVADKIGASALQACIEDAIDENDSETSFIKRLEIYGGVEMNDVDIRNSAKSIYDKYVL